MFNEKSGRSNVAGYIVGPILSLLAFLITYYLDPLRFGDQNSLAAIPAVLLSVVILIIDQSIRTNREIEKTSLSSERLQEVVRNHIQVSTVGSPEQALRYIIARLPALREVRNTSFTFDGETERSDERFYKTKVYEGLSNEIARQCAESLLWKDVGDQFALQRMRRTDHLCKLNSPQNAENYKYRAITHIEPQINFIILEFFDGSSEVLFNWDFRRIGRDPVVLVSRDHLILDMFAVQFSLLWRTASPDHDMEATRSDSTK